MDAGATFQFVADALPATRSLVALDWRGFGRSAWPDDGYWFPDYYADLDALLDQLSPDAPATLIGHSMGGNIAMMYAGIRPERVRAVVCIDAFGLPGRGLSRRPSVIGPGSRNCARRRTSRALRRMRHSRSSSSSATAACDPIGRRLSPMPGPGPCRTAAW